MTNDDWPNTCAICVARGIQTRLKYGFCCAACLDRMKDNLTAIPALIKLARHSLVQSFSRRNGTGIPVYGSRPPVNVDALDPALAEVPKYHTTMLNLLEEWERRIRRERQMTQYGPASHARAAAHGTTETTQIDSTTAAIDGVCAFLASQLDWTAHEPSFPLDELSAAIRECRNSAERWNPDRTPAGTMIRCPTNADDTECGYRLKYYDVNDDITCPRCRVTRSAMTLAAVALADGRDIWLDAEAAATHLGISESTLYRMARRGIIEKSHGRYRITATRRLIDN